MAHGGMLTKQADFLTAKKLNDVNDASSGGVIVSLPSGVTGPQVSQTIPGDVIVLDDATASALSDTAVGTLYGGLYMYVQTYASSTASPALGAAAFMRAADLPPAAIGLYQVTADAQPTAALPTLYAGVFINAITKGNFGWIQTGGVISVLFDSTITTAAVGNPVTIKTSPTVASTFDVGVPAAATLAGTVAAVDNLVGIAIVLPVLSTVTAVLQTRNPFARI
jgi:hypothetical protein